MLIIGLTRIALTYSVFSQTYDEPAHIAAGMEWLDRGQYVYEPMHPPLPRIAVALGPYFAGGHSFGEKSFWDEGARILEAGGSYMHTLTLARFGVLPFFVCTIIIVWLWARSLYGEVGGLIAAFLASTCAPLLAHSSIATTDMALVATLPAAVLASVRWLDFPTRGRAVVLGAAIGLTLVSKMSSVLYLPLTFFAVWLLWRLWRRREQPGKGEVQPPTRTRPVRRVASTSIVIVTAFVTVWASYRFSVSSPSDPARRPHEALDRLVGRQGRLHDLAYAVFEAPVVPAAEFVRGFRQLSLQAENGHKSYVLGHVGFRGWWYFFPLAIAVKTPLPILALFLVGTAGLVVRRRDFDWHYWVPLGCTVAMLAAVIPSTITVGFRHVLPILVFMILVAVGGTMALLRASQRKLAVGLVGLLLMWQGVDSARAHPDYLAYFNELARSHPDDFLVFSDLDWGQDTKRLADAARARHIDHLWIALNNGGARYEALGFPAISRLKPYSPVTGWIAADSYALHMGNNQDGDEPVDSYAWLGEITPIALIGKSIRLYQVDDVTASLEASRWAAKRARLALQEQTARPVRATVTGSNE
jgi:4-amino-4-deoxy-L-arabinose transferase-like glycosyltransferase